MSRLVDLVKIDRLDSLIRRKATGTPEELAERLGISRASVFNLIKFLREEMKAPIIYDSGRQSYIYSYPPKFNLSFERECLETTGLDNTFAGKDAVEVEAKTVKKKKIAMVEINFDYDYILDADIDFNDLDMNL
jgi:hypothetical protein